MAVRTWLLGGGPVTLLASPADDEEQALGDTRWRSRAGAGPGWGGCGRRGSAGLLGREPGEGLGAACGPGACEDDEVGGSDPAAQAVTGERSPTGSLSTKETNGWPERRACF